MTVAPTPEAAMVEVTQADRDALADHLNPLGHPEPPGSWAYSVRNGDEDSYSTLQLLARHRLAASPPPAQACSETASRAQPVTGGGDAREQDSAPHVAGQSTGGEGALRGAVRRAADNVKVHRGAVVLHGSDWLAIQAALTTPANHEGDGRQCDRSEVAGQPQPRSGGGEAKVDDSGVLVVTQPVGTFADGVEGAVRIAVWNAAKSRGMSDDGAYRLIELVVVDPAIHALQCSEITGQPQRMKRADGGTADDSSANDTAQPGAGREDGISKAAADLCDSATDDCTGNRTVTVDPDAFDRLNRALDDAGEGN